MLILDYEENTFYKFELYLDSLFFKLLWGSVTEAKAVNMRFIVNKAVLIHWFSLVIYQSSIVPYITTRQMYDRPKQQASYPNFEPLFQPQGGYYSCMDSRGKNNFEYCCF
jgi:hypothetical protein